MRKAIKQKLPPGWNEKEIQALIKYYDNQSDEEGAAEIETAEKLPGETFLAVPTELVPAITRLIEAHRLNGRAAKGRSARPASRRRRLPVRR